MRNKIESPFAERLQVLRKRIGLNQKQFAQFLEISQANLCGYERGYSCPSLNVLLTISRKCNVSIDWLCGLIPISYETKKPDEVFIILNQLMDCNLKGISIDIKITSQEAHMPNKQIIDHSEVTQ